MDHAAHEGDVDHAVLLAEVDQALHQAGGEDVARLDLVVAVDGEEPLELRVLQLDQLGAGEVDGLQELAQAAEDVFGRIRHHHRGGADSLVEVCREEEPLEDFLHAAVLARAALAFGLDLGKLDGGLADTPAHQVVALIAVGGGGEEFGVFKDALGDAVAALVAQLGIEVVHGAFDDALFEVADKVSAHESGQHAHARGGEDRQDDDGGDCILFSHHHQGDQDGRQHNAGADHGDFLGQLPAFTLKLAQLRQQLVVVELAELLAHWSTLIWMFWRSTASIWKKGLVRYFIIEAKMLVGNISTALLNSITAAL